MHSARSASTSPRSTPVTNATPAAAPSARKTGDIPASHLKDLNLGTVEARTLTEALAIDQRQLLLAALPTASPEIVSAVAAAAQLGVLARMRAVGAALHAHLDEDALSALATHQSDTVRGWACFALGANPELDLPALLERAHPLADDSRFTVREWVWMALRPRLVAELSRSIELLAPWTASSSDNIRRFASESLRPRGVWASHIAALTTTPQLGEPLLEPLRADPARYVQDSVANWINDAAKTQPAWALALCDRWNSESPTAATRRITHRGLRSLR